MKMSVFIIIVSNFIITQHLLLIQPSKSVEMALPIGRIDTGVFDWIAAVYHHAISAIYPHMAHRTARIVSTRKKDNIPRLCVCRRNRSTLVINSLRRGSWQVMYPAVGKYPADKTGTVKRCGRA